MGLIAFFVGTQLSSYVREKCRKDTRQRSRDSDACDSKDECLKFVVTNEQGEQVYEYNNPTHSFV